MSSALLLVLSGGINFLTAFIQACTGFGYGLFAMPLMALFFPMSTCSAISAVTVLVIALQMTWKLRSHVCLKTIALPVLSSLATINLGLYMLDVFDELVLRIILAGLLIIVTILSVITSVKKISFEGKWYYAVMAGLVTGVSTGMFNIAGPFLMIYYLNTTDDTLCIKASLESSFLILGIYSTVMHVFRYHNINRTTAPLAIVAAIGALIAGELGLRLYKKINKKTISVLMYILIPLMAIMLIFNGLKNAGGMYA